MNDHPYTYDRWAPDDPEFAVVRVDDLRKMERACQGIWAISRIVGNSLNEPGATGASPITADVMSNLMGGVESLCHPVSELITDLLDEARSNEQRSKYRAQSTE